MKTFSCDKCGSTLVPQHNCQTIFRDKVAEAIGVCQSITIGWSKDERLCLQCLAKLFQTLHEQGHTLNSL